MIGAAAAAGEGEMAIVMVRVVTELGLGASLGEMNSCILWYDNKEELRSFFEDWIRIFQI